ncbi:YkgJ family cysteine cluster protein [Planctomicrobium piriforme]|uniref:Putative zinc-or iron-chelating domain-containing protein n=1 Tax=Planctomicrobium piriforme TaxID=1576369 RepID=A0A1I3FC80_9PLAN|nr:YkgJ family cysteine cluster protein [Planctomicrobium piriforme]SFI08825.1 Putative zinc-or iron-chelating domain-containing protein [Planctomicrobium piriforme]
MPKPLPVLSSCDGCGACCQTVSAPPFRIDHLVNEPQAKGVPIELVEEFMTTWYVRLQITESPCMWFDSEARKCRHYDIRPDACREFEINSPSCHAVREVWRLDD